MREQDAKLKSILLDMFSWFHEFCVQNGLRYYALGGTMLGAARHGGFIPWDDDIDVGMPREDYMRLEALMGSSPQEPYILETPYSKAFTWTFFRWTGREIPRRKPDGILRRSNSDGICCLPCTQGFVRNAVFIKIWRFCSWVPSPTELWTEERCSIPSTGCVKAERLRPVPGSET